MHGEPCSRRIATPHLLEFWAESERVIRMLLQTMNWFLSNWMEVASLVIAITALIYAALAHSSAKRSSRAAEISDNTSFKIQANSALVEAESEFIRLKMNCQTKREAWDVYKRKHLPPLSTNQPDGLKSIDDVLQRGNAILHEVQQNSVRDGDLDSKQLADVIRKANAASLELQALSGRLERPPNGLN